MSRKDRLDASMRLMGQLEMPNRYRINQSQDYGVQTAKTLSASIPLRGSMN